MICKNCKHRVVAVSKEEQKEHDVGKYAHGTSKREFIVYPLNTCHNEYCKCKNPQPSAIPQKEKEKK